MKRPAPDGATHLVLTPLQLVKKLAALVPPPRFNLTRLHGLFAPNSRLRKKVVPSRPQPDAPDTAPPPTLQAPPDSPEVPSRYRLPWAELLRRTFAVDVLTCHLCHSRRKVLAFISHVPTTRRILRHLQLPCGPPPIPQPALPPQLTFEPLDASA